MLKAVRCLSLVLAVSAALWLPAGRAVAGQAKPGAGRATHS